MSLSINIRVANANDAPILAELAFRTFRDAYADNNSQSDMVDYLKSFFTVETIAGEIAHEDNRFLLAFFDDRLTGYAKLRRSEAKDGVTGPKPVELQRLYADKLVTGNGVGSQLMERVISSAAESGHQTVWLGVWEQNVRAIKFYERWGFEVVGTHIFTLGTDDQTDLVMQRSVV